MEFQPVHVLFEQQAEHNPERIAVVFGEDEITYQSLNLKANELANLILAKGIKREHLVGICLHRSVEMIIAVLAVMKAGGAYVPLDPTYPQEHLNFILNNARPQIIITDKKNKNKFLKQQTKVLVLNSITRSVVEKPSRNLNLSIGADHLIYCICTSGSTGRPKGVLVEHHSLANFANTAVKDYGITNNDRILQFASLNFDTSAEEIFPALISGTTLVLRTDDMLDSISRFFRLCENWQISILDLPTAFWHELVIYLAKSKEKLPSKLKLIIIGGERVSPVHLNTWHKLGFKSVRLDNTYGLTECTCVVSRCELTPQERKIYRHREVAIGKAIEHVDLFVLDENRQPVPVGVPGELYVGGECLARGYLNLPDLTAERFISHQFTNGKSEHLYRTGDLVQWRPDDMLEYLGRIDEQIKIRGFRIEPGEIESILMKFPGVIDSIVIKRTDPSGNDQLVAYLVMKTGESVSEAGLKDFLSSHLPKYMLPSYFQVMKEFPLSPNHKIDKIALPDPDWDRSTEKKILKKLETPAEKKLLRIWEETLNRKGIGVEENFFDIGGHSLLAARMMTEVERQFGQSIPLVILLKKPTIRELAKAIVDVNWKPSWQSLVALKEDGDNPPLFLVHAIGGDILSYRRLVNRLKTLDRPVYGIRAQGLGGKTEPIHTVEEMAAFYIKELRAIQPAGPYYLGGYSFGGTISYEMAQQLLSSGEKIAFLAMFDTVVLENLPPHLLPSRLDMAFDHLARVWFVVKKWMGLSLPKKAEYIRKLTGIFKGRLRAWVKHEEYITLQEFEDRDRRTCKPHAFQLVESVNNEALAAYKAKILPGRITLFKAKQREWSEMVNPEPLWRKLAQDGMDVYICAGNHNTILVEPYVEDLAQKLKKALKDLEGKRE